MEKKEGRRDHISIHVRFKKKKGAAYKERRWQIYMQGKAEVSWVVYKRVFMEHTHVHAHNKNTTQLTFLSSLLCCNTSNVFVSLFNERDASSPCMASLQGEFLIQVMTVIQDSYACFQSLIAIQLYIINKPVKQSTFQYNNLYSRIGVCQTTVNLKKSYGVISVIIYGLK